MDSADKIVIQKPIKKAKFDTVKQKSYRQQVLCKHCNRWMHDSNLKRHMRKMHSNLTLIKNENEIQEEIKKSKLVEDEQVEKMQKEDSPCYEQSPNEIQEQVKKRKLVEDEQVEQMQEKGTSCYEQSPSKSSIPTDIEDEILQYNAIYLKKMEIGKHVYEAIINGTCIEEALPKKYRQAHKFYRKRNLMVKKVSQTVNCTF